MYWGRSATRLTTLHWLNSQEIRLFGNTVFIFYLKKLSRLIRRLVTMRHRKTRLQGFHDVTFQAKTWLQCNQFRTRWLIVFTMTGSALFNKPNKFLHTTFANLFCTYAKINLTTLVFFLHHKFLDFSQGNIRKLQIIRCPKPCLH